MANAIGMVELTSIARGIETSDFMVKAAQVELIRSSTCLLYTSDAADE